MLRNHLKIIVMNKLKDKSMSGYDLIKEIHTSTGSWKPSFGSMYPLLKELHKNKLVSVKVVDRKKIYSLTTQGIKVLEEALSASQDSVKMMLKEFKIMESICTPQERSHAEIIINDIKKNNVPFANMTKDIADLQSIMFKLQATGKTKSKEKEIKKILKETTIKLKKI